MTPRRHAHALIAVFLVAGCSQQLGEVCQGFPGMGDTSDCATDLVCCGETTTCTGGLTSRGI